MEVVKKVKLNLTVAQEVKDYLIQESDQMGMSCSAFITMLINQSKQQKTALESLDLIKIMMTKIEEMEAKIE